MAVTNVNIGLFYPTCSNPGTMLGARAGAGEAAPGRSGVQSLDIRVSAPWFMTPTEDSSACVVSEFPGPSAAGLSRLF